MCNLSALKCPLCAQTNFPNIDSLRFSLIKAANGPLTCPICHELFLGLDKLTIHLFSHTNVMMNEETTKVTPKQLIDTTVIKQQRTIDPKLKKVSTVNSEIKLETEETVNASIKRTVREKKTKKIRQLIDNEPKEIEKINQKSSYNEQIAKVDNIRDINKLDNNLSICDICEFTFRDEELRSMHFRLVHQHINSSGNGDLTINGVQSSEADFKCHLCSKTFKMKGSLRVHLKVVHLMCLPYIGNGPKLSICDRIRQKETKIQPSNVNNSTHCITQPMSIQKTDNEDMKIMSPIVATQLLQQQHQISLTANTSQTATQVPNGLTLGALALVPASAATPNTTAGGLLNLKTNGELVHAVDGTPLNSNVLLVINTNPSALFNSNPGPIDGNGENKSKLVANGSGELLDLQYKNASESAKIWKCNECSKTFTTKYFLKKHKRLHTGEMPYTCEICARTFTFQQSYHKHLLYHSNEKPHVCSTCGRAFKELSTLHNHERIHSGEKPFKCEVCGKCFRQRVSFLVHTRIHTGVMPYKCDACQKSFRYKVSQRTHKCTPTHCSQDKEDTESDATKPMPEPTTDDISESFIQEFLENTNVHLGDTQNSSPTTEMAIINTTSDCNGNAEQELLTKAIDDIIVESCNKMGIGCHQIRTTDVPPPPCSDDCNSPTQRLQNMRLYSPQLVTGIADGKSDDIDNNIFPQFLLDDVENNIL